jgi:thermitase
LANSQGTVLFPAASSHKSGQPAKWNAGVTVAVLDTGIDANHTDLSGKIIADINLTDSITVYDINGHGTHIAGIIAARKDDCLDNIAPESRLLNVKVADDQGNVTLSALRNGIVWAADRGANVINISIEMPNRSVDLESAVNYAWEKGAIVIAAAGNDGDELPVYPAYYDNSIAVTALGRDHKLAPLANIGDWVDVAAPGFNVYSTTPLNSYGYKTGTSSAAAYVSGLAAMLFSNAADIDRDGALNDEVRMAIEAGSHRISVDGFDIGEIDTIRSLEMLSDLN